MIRSYRRCLCNVYQSTNLVKTHSLSNQFNWNRDSAHIWQNISTSASCDRTWWTLLPDIVWKMATDDGNMGWLCWRVRAKLWSEFSNFVQKLWDYFCPLMPCLSIGPKWFWIDEIVLVGSKSFCSGSNF